MYDNYEVPFLGPLCSRTAFEIWHFPSLILTLNWCPAGLDLPGPYGHARGLDWGWPLLLLLDLLCRRGHSLATLAACCGHRLPLPPACSCCSWQQTFLSGLAGHPQANAWFHQFLFTEDRVSITDSCSLWNVVHHTWYFFPHTLIVHYSLLAILYFAFKEKLLCPCRPYLVGCWTFWQICFFFCIFLQMLNIIFTCSACIWIYTYWFLRCISEAVSNEHLLPSTILYFLCFKFPISTMSQ